MIPGETVISGAKHPKTRLRVMKSVAGYYLGFVDEWDLPYSRESVYFDTEQEATEILEKLRA